MKNKSMLIAGLGILAAIVVGYLLIGGKDSNPELAIDTAALENSYRLEFDGVEDGENISGTFDIDKDGNVSANVSGAGQEIGYISLDGVTYFQNPEDGQWYYYSSDSSASQAFDVSDFSISEEDIAEITDDETVVYIGEQECTAGKCNVWQDTDESTDETTAVKIEVGTNRLSDVSITNNKTGEVNTITYTYPDNISIVAPEGATQIGL